EGSVNSSVRTFPGPVSVGGYGAPWPLPFAQHAAVADGALKGQELALDTRQGLPDHSSERLRVAPHGSSCQRALSGPLVALVVVSVDEGGRGIGTLPVRITWRWYFTGEEAASKKAAQPQGDRDGRGKWRGRRSMR